METRPQQREPGGIEFTAYLEKLREQVTAYLGQLQEEAAGLKPDPADRVEQPEELYWYNIMQGSDLPLTSGGILEQPYMMFMAMLVIRRAIREYEGLLKKLNAAFTPPPQQ